MERSPGKYERLSAERHARDLDQAERPGGHPRGLRFDATAGDRAVQFVEGFCRHHKGEWAGRPLELQEWQRSILRQMFGWYRADGTRRFRISYVEIPRKNGKSTIGAAVGLYLLVADGEPGAEVYSSATKKDQAKIVWDAAKEMVLASKELKRFVKASRNTLSVARTASKFEALSADGDTLDGLNPHGNIVDELHAHKDRSVWDVLDTAMGARRQPMTLAITTAGTYDPETIGWELHEYATKILEGVLEDDRFFAFIASADEPPEGQPEYYFSAAAHAQANPGLDISVKPSFLADQAKQALQQPSALNEYLRLHLNVWTRTVTRWLSLEHWAESDPMPTAFDLGDRDLRAWALAREQSLVGKACFGALDLSTKLDLSSLVLLFDGGDDYLDLVCRFWLPEATVAKYAKGGQRQYETWVREGWLTETPGDVIDYEWIRKEITALAGGVDPATGASSPARFRMQELAYDPWGATQLATQLMGDGHKLIEVRQGFKSLSEPSKDLEARIVSKKVRHANNPILRFCVSNAVITRDAAGNIKPDKEKAVQRIDGVVATVMALSRLICNKTEGNAYEHRGFLSLD